MLRNARRPITIAVVGCGYVTQAEHVPALLEALPDIRVTTAVGL